MAKRIIASIGLLVLASVVVIYQEKDFFVATTLHQKSAIRQEDTAKVDTTGDSASPRPSRRKFISYTSSAWEQLWLDNIAIWEKNQSICQVLLQNNSIQLSYLHDFLNLTCTHRYEPHDAYPGAKWCIIDDNYQPLWYDTANRDRPMVIFRKPIHLDDKWPEPTALPTTTFGTQHEHVLSKFEYQDELTKERYVEYIEPLVAALRHPLAHCDRFKTRFSTFRGYVIPPPRPRHAAFRNYLYFDAGASSWRTGPGGPSLSYFYHTWERQGIHFNEIHAFEPTTTHEEFQATLPDYLKEKNANNNNNNNETTVTYHQCYVSSNASIDTPDNPFLPKLIKRTLQDNNNNNDDTYVLFKLDIDSPHVEAGNVEYILEDSSAVNLIDELVWEHHVNGNYLMLPQWGTIWTNMTLSESYQLFYRLRNEKGIRAHSWV